jgi:hypothetical protein
LSNNIGSSNTATGNEALASNTIGGNNTANGVGALGTNTTGNDNTAMGVVALVSNTIGVDNTANGYQALYHNTIGNANTATGKNALVDNTEGLNNTAIGYDALQSNTTGNNNTAIGYATLANITTGGGNIAIGAGAGSGFSTANGTICIGTGGSGNVSDSCFIGNIFGATSSGGVGVFINGAGQLGTATSSRRFKDEIKPMAEASDTLFALKPVTFRYKKEIDPKRIAQFGLVAEDVEAVNSDLVVRDKDGKPYSVRYEQVNAMLLNEFLKEHRKVQELAANAAQQEKRIEALTAGLEKVNAQLEASKPVPQVVNNP